MFGPCGLGIAYTILGDVDDAITFHKQALTIARQLGDRRAEAGAAFNMAVVLDSLGLRDDAIRHAAHALVIYDAIEDPGAEKVRRALAKWRGEA